MLRHAPSPPQRKDSFSKTRERRNYNTLAALLLCIILCGFYLFTQFRAPEINEYNQKDSTTSLSNLNSGVSTASIFRKYSSTGKKAIGLNFTFEKVAHFVVTTRCSSKENLNTQVLSTSARQVGVQHGITRILYDCTDLEISKLQPHYGPPGPPGHGHGVSLHIARDLPPSNEKNGGIHPHAIDHWLRHGATAKQIDEKDYIVLLEDDTIITKEITLKELLRLAEVKEYVAGFAQGPTWFKRHELLPQEELIRVCGKTSPCIDPNFDWQYYAVAAPYVIQKRHLVAIIDTYKNFWDKLEDNQNKQYAYPLTIAHHDVKHEFVSFRLSDIQSTWENWNFDVYLEKNPCNSRWFENSHINDFPLTMKSGLYTLNRWMDGRKYIFSNDLIPTDFLDCDSWMLQMPPIRLYYLATHTRGDERISVIERRRHVWAICTCIDVFNQAALEFKQENCPHGFNRNQKLKQTLDMKKIISAKPPLLSDKNHPHHHQSTPLSGRIDDGDITTTAGGITTTTTAGGEGLGLFGDHYYGSILDTLGRKHDDPMVKKEIHTLFVTGCMEKDHLLSETMLHSASSVGHDGRITRILTGCTVLQINHVLDRKSSYSNLFYHFVPLTNTTTWNHASAMNHASALNHYFSFGNPSLVEEVVLLVQSNFIWMKDVTVPSHIKFKQASAQKSPKSDWRILPIEKRKQVCSNLKLKTCEFSTDDDSDVALSIGFPLMMMTKDFVDILPLYLTVANTIESWLVGQPNHVVDTLAWNMAAVSFRNVTFFPFSYVLEYPIQDETDKYWEHIDNLRVSPCHVDLQEHLDLHMIPSFYRIPDQLLQTKSKDGDIFTFSYDLLPRDIYTCDAQLLAFPPDNTRLLARKEGIDASRNLFVLCYNVKALNTALMAYKTKHCSSGFNSNRKWRFIKS